MPLLAGGRDTASVAVAVRHVVTRHVRLLSLQWRRKDFVTGGEVSNAGSEVWVVGLEYEVPQKLTHLLQCIGNL